MTDKFEESINNVIDIYDIPVSEGIMNAGRRLYKRGGKFADRIQAYGATATSKGGDAALMGMLFGGKDKTFIETMEAAAAKCETTFVWNDKQWNVPKEKLRAANCSSSGSSSKPPKPPTPKPPPKPPSPRPVNPGPGSPPRVPSSPGLGPPPAPPSTLEESPGNLAMNKFNTTILKGTRAYVLEQGPDMPEGLPPELPAELPPGESALPPEGALEAPPEEEVDPDMTVIVPKLIELARDALLYTGDIDAGALGELSSEITIDNVDTIEGIISDIVRSNEAVDARPVANYARTS